MKTWSRPIAYSSMLLLLLLHLPFLRSDPDYFLSIGRDAFTDEGLNTSQLRNYINHGTLGLHECDNMIKCPLFNILLYVPLSVFGTHWIVARLVVLFFVLGVLILFSRKEHFRSLIPILIITTFTQVYVFQYSHFSLSEMMAVGFVLLAIQTLATYLETENRKLLLGTAFLLSCAYFAKIQFVYVIALLPCSLLLIRWLKISPPTTGMPARREMLYAGLALLCLLIVYIAIWYFPNRGIFDQVMMHEAPGKFAAIAKLPQTIAFNIEHRLFGSHTAWFNGLTAICFAAGLFLLRRSRNSRFRNLFVISSAWMMIELHKISMVYLPSRYFVSYYFAAGLMCSVVLQHLIANHESKLFFRTGMAIAALFLIFNSMEYGSLLQRRAYNIEAINHYFSSTLKNTDQPVMGPWAPSATWGCKARSIPVWKDFMNDRDLFNRFHPQAILSEPDEAESKQAYSSQGIDLKALADSSRTFKIGRWDVIVYWMPDPVGKGP